MHKTAAQLRTSPYAVTAARVSGRDDIARSNRLVVATWRRVSAWRIASMAGRWCWRAWNGMSSRKGRSWQIAHEQAFAA
jgi:hypothetical protein